MLGAASLLPGEIYLGFAFKPVFCCAVRRFSAEMFLRSPLWTPGPLSFLGLFFDSVGPLYFGSFEKQQNTSIFAPLFTFTIPVSCF